jgi:hypothetical protein
MPTIGRLRVRHGVIWQEMPAEADHEEAGHPPGGPASAFAKREGLHDPDDVPLGIREERDRRIRCDFG